MTLAVEPRLQSRSNLSIVCAILGKPFAPVLRKQPRAGANARFAASSNKVTPRQKSRRRPLCLSGPSCERALTHSG